MNTAVAIEAGSALLVGLVALGTIVNWVTQRQSAHISAVIDAKLGPLKEAAANAATAASHAKDTLGEKNGNDETAMSMLIELLKGQDRAAELERDLLELHEYTHDGVHRLNGQVGMMWREWAKEHGYDPDQPPPPEPSPSPKEKQ